MRLVARRPHQPQGRRQVPDDRVIGQGTAAVAGPIGWGLAWWGLVLYWIAGAMYAVQAARLVRAARTLEEVP